MTHDQERLDFEDWFAATFPIEEDGHNHRERLKNYCRQRWQAAKREPVPQEAMAKDAGAEEWQRVGRIKYAEALIKLCVRDGDLHANFAKKIEDILFSNQSTTPRGG